MLGRLSTAAVGGRLSPSTPRCSLCGNRANVFRPMIGAISAEMKSMGCDMNPF